MKKLRILLLSLVITMFLAIPVAAEESFYYTDVTGHWGELNIYYITNKGLLNGYPDRTFRPDNAITRGELVTILSKDAGADTSAYANANSFSDISRHWAKNAINWAAANGIVNGYENGTFRPDTAISRQDLATMLDRYLKNKGLPLKYPEDPFNDQAKIGSWATSAVTTMQRYGLIQGRENHYFYPTASSTRAETATIIARYLRILNGESGNSSLADIYVNNSLKKSGVIVSRETGNTMVGLRDFFEAIGYEVAYYGNTSLVA
ncbi:MAG: S-layer homology domain-containing protein, partial [Bacillota bacterium]|nr:S-layer homology domain-containing protein [Bacillota bacterium]